MIKSVMNPYVVVPFLNNILSVVIKMASRSIACWL